MAKRILLLTMLIAIGYGASAHTTEAARRAFQKMQTLAGDWEGTDERGRPVKSNFALAAASTALLETLRMPDGDEMLTIYSVDRNSIVLLHYCPTNNQPQMRATPPDGEVRELVFEFQRAGNLPSLETGHEHKLVILFQDRDHLTERWTWRQNGGDRDAIYRLTRKARMVE